MQGETEIIEIKPRRKRRSLEQIGELVREFGSSGLTQRQFCEERGIGLERVAAEPENCTTHQQRTQANGGGS
jgi:hypothetical protein